MSMLATPADSSSTDAVERPRSDRPVLTFFLMLVVYSLMTAGFFWQWIPHLHTALIGPPEDNMQDFWNTYYVAVARRGTFFFTNLIRFPEGTSLYYHSFAYPKVFAVALLSRIAGTDLPTLVCLHNLSLLMSFPLAAIGAFYLIRHLTGHVAGALVGGVVFAFNPSHIEHVMHHAHVSSIEFIPFFVLAYLLALERKSVIWLLLAIVLYTLSALSCWYYLFYIAYFIGFHTVYIALRDRTLPIAWRLVVPATSLVGPILALSPLLVPMIAMAMGSARVYEGGHDVYVADVSAYVAFPKFHLLSFLSERIFRRLTGNVWEATVYLGLVNLAVIAWLSFGMKDGDRRLLRYAVLGMVLFAIFASGDSLHVLGRRMIYMPGHLLSHLPFFSNVRAPSRAIVFVYLFLAVIIGQAGASAWRQRHRDAVRYGMVLVAVLTTLDFYPAGALAVTPVSCSAGLSVIRDDPERDFGILNLPSGRSAAYTEGNYYMLQQACHGRPIAQGNIARNVAMTLRDRLEAGDLERQRQQLAESKVKYIVISHPMAGHLPWRDSDGLGRFRILFQWRVEDGLQERYREVYLSVYDSPDLTILRVY